MHRKYSVHVFICDLFHDLLHISEYMVSPRKMFNVWTVKDVEGSGHSLFEVITVLEFAWKD
jgi:hypothetical protein